MASIGASLIQNLVSEAEETQLVEHINSTSWSNELNRRVQHYGYKYDYRNKSAAQRTTPIPTWIEFLTERLNTKFSTEFTQCIINEYTPGQGIGMHTDAPIFGEIIVSVSLNDSWTMRFRHSSVRPYNRDGLPGDKVVMLPRRSGLVLTELARSQWMHGICRNDSKNMRRTRISLTFRTIR